MHTPEDRRLRSARARPGADSARQGPARAARHRSGRSNASPPARHARPTPPSRRRHAAWRSPVFDREARARHRARRAPRGETGWCRRRESPLRRACDARAGPRAAHSPLRPRAPEPQHGERPALQRIRLASAEGGHPRPEVPVTGVEHQLPAHARLVGGKDEGNGLVVRIQEQEEGVGHNGLSPPVHLLDAVAGQPQAEAAREAIAPLVFGHLLAIGPEPREVLDGGAVDAPPLEEQPPVEDRIVETQPDDPAREVELTHGRPGEGPGVPGQLVVLAVRVVVAMLGAPRLVAGQEHGDALGEEEGSEEVACLALPQRVHAWIVGGSLRAAVPRGVVVGAVTVVLTVGLVVLAVVGHEVREGESIVGGDEVDAGEGTPPSLLVEIARAGEAIAEIGDLPLVALPVATNGIAVASVPLCPARGEVAHLVAALTQVPRLGDQFYL